MITENKYRWMVWAIVILAVMNISTILTLVYQRNQVTKAEITAGSDQVEPESATEKFSGRYFREELDLTRDQMTGFSEFNPQFRQQVKGINENLTRIRQQMLAEMTAGESSIIKLDLLSDSIGYLHADLKKLTYKYYLDFKSICNKQQQQKLEQLFSEMFTADVGMGQHGKGGPYGRGRGRGFNN
jgi:hypothetical protein